MNFTAPPMKMAGSLEQGHGIGMSCFRLWAAHNPNILPSSIHVGLSGRIASFSVG